MKKEDLRKKLLKKMETLDQDACRENSQQIFKKLCHLSLFKKAKKIGLYFSKDNEVHTHTIVKNYLKSREIFLPRIKTRDIEFKKIKKISELEVGKFKILEPKKECPSLSPAKLDLIITPCVAIDKNGNRIGRGKGFYDRLIAKYPTIITVCLAYELQLLPKIKAHSLDQKVNYIITEKKVIQTKKTLYPTKILDGKRLSESILFNLKKNFKNKKIKAKLAVILVGDDPASKIYVRKKKEMCKEVGIKFKLIKFKEDVLEKGLIQTIEKLNKNKKVTGIIIQLPLPKQINSKKIIASINPDKDIDGLTQQNQKNLINGNETLACCAPKGIIRLLENNNIELKNKKIVIIGYGQLVGKPLSLMLKNRDINFEICTNKTKNLKQKTEKADILISATGVPHLLTKSHVKKGAIIIDAGTSKLNNKLVGDVNFKEVIKKINKITPIPGGVGPMTVAMLIENIKNAHKIQNKNT